MVNQDSEHNLGFLLHEVTRLMRRNLDRRIRPLGLTQAQWRALAYLARHEGINQAGLAELLEVRPITLARLIDRLEAAGWAERRADPNDRRACRLFLTDRALPLIEQMRAFAAETREQALAGLTPVRRRQLIETLCHMKAGLLAGDAAPAEPGAKHADDEPGGA